MVRLNTRDCKALPCKIQNTRSQKWIQPLAQQSKSSSRSSLTQPRMFSRLLSGSLSMLTSRWDLGLRPLLRALPALGRLLPVSRLTAQGLGTLRLRLRLSVSHGQASLIFLYLSSVITSLRLYLRPSKEGVFQHG